MSFRPAHPFFAALAAVWLLTALCAGWSGAQENRPVPPAPPLPQLEPGAPFPFPAGSPSAPESDPFGPGFQEPGGAGLSPAPLTTAPEASETGTEAAPRVPLEARKQNRPQVLWMEGRQFVVWGGSVHSRSALFTAASSVRRDVLAALRREDDRWRHPIVLQIREPHAQPPGTPPVWTEIAQVAASESAAAGEAFRLEINITPRGGSVPGPLLKRNLVRAILAEMILRGNEKRDLSLAAAPPPDWLLHGVLELLDYRELGRLSDSFATVFRLGRVLSVEEIFQADADGMDSVSSTIFRVSCCGLLMTLLEQPEGTEGFTALLAGLARSPGQDETAVLNAFPSLRSSSNSLGKWWSLQIATLAQPSQDELLSPAETERQLAAALILHSTPPAAEDGKKRASGLTRLFQRSKPPSAGSEPGQEEKPAADSPPPGGDATDIQDFQKLLGHPGRRAVFEQTGFALTQLLMRAHPLYRPIIREYHEVVERMAAGKKVKTATAVLKRLAATRQRLTRDLRAVEDYLDWYLATLASEKSGEFTAYLEAAEEMEKPPPPRTDPVGAYMDAVEREFAE